MPGLSRTVVTLACLSWRKSRYSVSGECVEVAATGEMVAVRDSNDRDGPIVVFPARAWHAFLRSIDSNA